MSHCLFDISQFECTFLRSNLFILAHLGCAEKQAPDVAVAGSGSGAGLVTVPTSGIVVKKQWAKWTDAQCEHLCAFFNVEIHAGGKILDAKVKEVIAKANISRQPSAVRQKLKEMRTKYRKLPQ